MNASTTYYYWATASNTYSSSDGISTSYETVTTLALAYSYNNITYDALDAYYACISNSPQTYYSTSSTFQAGIALYSNSNLSSSFLVPNGYYARNNKSYQVQNTNGILGAETQCSTTTVFRIRITFDYPSTNYYDMTTVKNQTLSTTSVMYFAVSFTSGRIMYTDVGLTTPYSGLGSFKTDRGATAFNYQRYPENKMFMARRQNLIGGVWTDLTSTATDSGYADYICQISSSGEIQILYWDYANTSFNISGSAGLTGIKISTSGSSDAATACNTPAFTIVYFKGTNLGNGTVIYTDSASAGTVSSSNKLNGGGNWYKFENNYRAQISSTGVVSNYASC